MKRQRRLLVPRRSLLARRWDHLEATVLAVAIGLCVVAVPIAVSIGADVSRHSSAVAREQQAQRHQSRAVTAADAPPEDPGQAYSTMPDAGEVPVVWKSPDGADRTGSVAVAAGTPGGSTVTVWLDTNENLTAEPMSSADVADLSVASAVLAWAGIVALAAGGAAVARVGLDRRRSEEWAREWERFTRRASPSE